MPGKLKLLKAVASILLMGLFILLAGACSSSDESTRDKDKTGKVEEEALLRVNKYLVTRDDEIIRNYIDRRGWDMERTETGLYYMIYEKGAGPRAAKGLYATLDYEVYLLDGTLCYASDSLDPKKFLIGQGGVESGLEQGILLLREGDKARFIMPPHLAHGLLGDDKKIPGRSVILYDLEVRDISKD